MKKIAIDSLPLVSGHSSRGMGVYARRLIENIKLIGQSDFDVNEFNFIENKTKLQNYDLIHYPYFDLFYRTLPFYKPTKTVVTVADVTPLLFPKYYPPGFRGSFNFALQKKSLKGADAVITISETSKADIVKYLSIAANKIFVTKLASNFSIHKVAKQNLLHVQKEYDLPKRFVLYIGDVNWNKNLLRLIEAVKQSGEILVIVGKSATRTDYDKAHIENLPLRTLQENYSNDRQVRRLGFVEDDELNAIWQLATTYCMPSLYEGFGLSVVEAMEAGVPVLSSNTPALVETAGEAALYFDPEDVSDMSAKLVKITKDSTLRKSLISKGYDKAKTYSWRKCAKETLAVYKHVLNLKFK